MLIIEFNISLSYSHLMYTIGVFVHVCMYGFLTSICYIKRFLFFFFFLNFDFFFLTLILQCSNSSCRVAYHPLCARAAGLCVEVFIYPLDTVIIQKYTLLPIYLFLLFYL